MAPDCISKSAVNSWMLCWRSEMKVTSVLDHQVLRLPSPWMLLTVKHDAVCTGVVLGMSTIDYICAVL